MTPDDTTTLRPVFKMQRVIDTMRATAPGLSLTGLQLFFAVALEPGKTAGDYAQVTGTISPITYRLLLELGPNARTGAGHGLMEQNTDEEDRRLRRWTLTDKGQELFDRMVRILND